MQRWTSSLYFEGYDEEGQSRKTDHSRTLLIDKHNEIIIM